MVTTRPQPRDPWRRPRLAAFGALFAIAACGGPAADSPAPTGDASGPPATTLIGGGTAEPTLVAPSDDPSLAPTAGPTATPAATPAATPILATGFAYSDILKVQVNRLAARVAPKRTAALVHAYDLSGPAPVDEGLVRLSAGDYVSVELGPLPIGDTTWYLVWPAPGAVVHPSGTQWYTASPGVGSPGPAWVAASVGSDVYMSLHRHPSLAEIEAWEPIGVTVAGRGNYQSLPQARHDGFNFAWAAAAPSSGTSCAIKIALVPSDGDFAPKVAINTTTTSVKTGPLFGAFLSAPWLPAAPGSWATFTVEVTSTCHWAFRLIRLEHD